jgi:AcrR family transcriptional regulator
MAVVAERGLYAARIEDITERADLGKGAFYNYFDSKEALIAELVTRGVAMLVERCLRAVGPNDPLAARTTAVLNAHDAFLREHERYALLIHQARGLLESNPHKGRPLRRAFTRYLEQMADILLPENGRRARSTAVRMNLAALITGMLFGYRSFCKAAGFNVDPRTLARVASKGLAAAAS